MDIFGIYVIKNTTLKRLSTYILKLIAKAKVNLSLLITGRKSNGYHTLNSFVAFAENIYDEIYIQPSHVTETTFTGRNFPVKEINFKNNTILKVIDLLNENLVEHGKNPEYFSINVKKHIPIGAGLGGGSADAAAVLKYLGKNLNFEKNTLYKIAEKIGADVPVCLNGKACIVHGIGEKIIPLKMKFNLPAVFINPNIPLATNAVFKHYSKTIKNFSNEIIHSIPNANLNDLINHDNDLQKSAIAKLPIIQYIIDVLQSKHGCKIAKMSGSGATCFGIFEDEKIANTALLKIRKEYPAWFVKYSNIISNYSQ